MKNIYQILFLLITLNCGFVKAQDVKNFYSIRDSISGQAIYNHLKILADDSLQGRGVGSTGERIAAEYIARQFQKYGLEKIPSENSYYQDIPMHGSYPLESSELTLYSGADTFKLKYAEDYFLYRSGQQTFIPVSLPLVFVGYGIIAPEYDYNDYQSVNVEGKIVVYIDGEPQSEDEDYFNGKFPTIYSYPESKRKIALGRGAAGTIQISLNGADSWKSVIKDFSFEDVTLAYSPSSNLSVIINPDIAYILFSESGFTFRDILDMHLNHSMKSFELKLRLKFEGVFKERDFLASNVIGIIRGSDPELNDTYLIVSAHYDHLGIGLPVDGDSVYNGALDNAIGVSVLLELAKSFSELNIKTKRSIIFIATTGEEKGLLGSIYYTDNPIVPLYKTIADVNIDGVAFFRNFKSLIGIGSEYSTLGDFLKITAEKYDLTLQGIPPQFRNFDAFNNSDQLAFATAGIPSIIVLDGLKNLTKTEDEVVDAFINYFNTHYHSPFDDLKQNIDKEAAAKHAKVLFDFCYELADQFKTPEWKSGSPYISAKLRTNAEKR
ncbi:MAG: M28 family peptidase [Ignavibacteriaceae bacterium]